jgi:hypothetical protein
MYTLFYNICSKTKVAIKARIWQRFIEYDSASQKPYTSLPVQGREETWASEPALPTPMAHRWWDGEDGGDIEQWHEGENEFLDFKERCLTLYLYMRRS